MTEEEVAGEQPVDESLSDSFEFALAESEELKALSPAAEAVLSRGEL